MVTPSAHHRVKPPTEQLTAVESFNVLLRTLTPQFLCLTGEC